MSVSIGELQRGLLRRRPWQLFGFGCLYVWLFSVVVLGTFFSADAPRPWVALVRLAMTAGMFVGYAACYLARDTPPMASFTRPRVLAFSAVISVATLAVAFPIDGPAAFVVGGIAAVAAGTGVAYHMNAGGLLWSDNPGELSLLQLTASVAAAFGVSALLGAAPHALGVAVACAAPVLGALILTNTREPGKPPLEDKAPGAVPQGSTERRLAAAVVLASFAFGCAFTALAACAGGGAVGARGTWEWLPVALPLLAVVSAFALALFTSLDRFLDGAFRACSFLVALGYLAAGLGVSCTTGAAGAGTGVGCALLLAGYLLFDEYLWLLHTGLAQHGGLSVMHVVSRYEALQWAGLALGCLAGFAVHELAGQGVEGLPWQAGLVAVCGGVSLFLLSVVFSPTEARRVVERRERMGFGQTLEDRCLELAMAHGLSPRELEVFRHLARGRSIAFVQEELGIAEGTVKVHARNIYRKLGVDNKQGLIELVDNRPKGA